MSTRYWGITLDDAVRGLCERDVRIAELEGMVRSKGAMLDELATAAGYTTGDSYTARALIERLKS